MRDSRRRSCCAANSSDTSPRSEENANERTFGSTSSRLYRNISMKRAYVGDRAADVAHREDLRPVHLHGLPLQVEHRVVVLHVPAQRARHVQLAAPEHFPATRVLGHEPARHAQHQVLHHPMMALFERRQSHVAQHVFAQAASGDVGVQQELMFDVVAHALAQPVAPMREIDGATPIRNGCAICAAARSPAAAPRDPSHP